MQSKYFFNFANALTAGAVNIECAYGGAGHGRQAFDLAAIKAACLESAGQRRARVIAARSIPPTTPVILVPPAGAPPAQPCDSGSIK